MKHKILALFTVGSFFLSCTVQAWTASSPAQQTQLVELFTSQGCSSCPPADRWLTSFKSRNSLWRDIVPVAWHVTYWDYVGWRDPFASKHNDNRQRRMAALAGAGVYTPGVFVNRNEWLGWRRSSLSLPEAQNQRVGILSGSSENEEIKVQFSPVAQLELKAPVLELVFLRAGLNTPVKAGENRGRKLKHDFVAGRLTRVPLVLQQGHWIADFSLKPEEESEAVALWVLDRQGRYLQATGSWIIKR